MTNFSQLSSHLISFEAHLYATPRHFRCALLPFLLYSILALFHTRKALALSLWAPRVKRQLQFYSSFVSTSTTRRVRNYC